jgi:GTPase SAR1 family protein
MPIICFFGADGSGKSTLAKALTKRLNNKNFRAKLSWMRGTHTLASLLARLLSMLTTFKGSENPYYGISIPRNLKRHWQLVEFASTLPIILLKFILPSALGSWVVAERYAPDFITWVSLITNDQHYPESIEAKFLLALSSKAHTKIYVTATLKELSRRRKGTNPISISDQLKLYDRIASAIHAHRLDTTNKSANESLEEALSLLNTR